MKDPPVITCNGESLLNAVLYGSDEFNDKINKEVLYHIIPNRANDKGWPREAWAPTFLCNKNKKGKQRKK